MDIRSKRNGQGWSWIIKTILFFGCIILVFIISSIYRETSKKNQIEKEVEKLRNEADNIKKENLKLENKIAYFESNAYREMEAKDKLNLKNPDENIMIVKPSISEEHTKKNNSREDFYQEESEKENSNYKKWWDYFFEY